MKSQVAFWYIVPISVTIILSFTSSVLGADESYNFDSEPVGQTPNGWVLIEESGDHTVSNVQSHSKPNSVRITDVAC